MDNQERNKKNPAGRQSHSALTESEDFGSQPMEGDEANEDLAREVSSWEGVTVHNHTMGGVEFRYGGHNLGHIHEPPGETATADLEFSMETRNELVASGRARPHITDRQGETGWITVAMGTVSEVANAIELFEHKYIRIAKKIQKSGGCH